MTSFRDWINQKFIEWEKQSGRRRTLNQFADYLGVSRVIVSMWMNGTRTPSRDNASLLAQTFGPEIYDILNLPRPDPDLQTITYLWPRLPETARRAIREQAERYAASSPPEPEPRPAET